MLRNNNLQEILVAMYEIKMAVLTENQITKKLSKPEASVATICKITFEKNIIAQLRQK